MFLIPNWLISAFSFPGVMIHEFSHEMFCYFFGVKVNKVVYFQFDNKVAGYVNHEAPKKVSQLFWISMGPIVGNTIMAILFAHYCFYNAPSFSIKIVTIWLSFAIALHAFPSNTDAKNILEEARIIRKNGGSIFYYLAYPFFALIWIINKLKLLWFDVFYALLLIYIGYSI